MDQPPEENPAESWKRENTTTPSTAGQTNNRENNQKKNQAEGEEANDQTHADPVNQSSYKQTYGTAPNQTGQIDQSGQVNQGTYEQAVQKWSKQSEWSNSQQAEQKFSGQIDKRTSQTTDSKVSHQSDRRPSEKGSDKFFTLDGRTSEQIDYRFPAGQGTSGLAQQMDQVNYRMQESTEDSEFTREQYNRQFMLNMQQEGQNEGIFGEVGQKDYYPPYNEAFNQYQDQIFSELVSDDIYGFKVESCTFEKTSSDMQDQLSGTSEAEMEGTSAMPSYRMMDTRFTNAFPTRVQGFSQKLPSISTGVAYPSSQEKPQTMQSNLSGPYSGRKTQGFKKRFPPIIYEDPYHVSLQYMERHGILQIFQQITENLVYEKPDDPLNFMLYQKLLPTKEQ
ncbi:testis-specific expressed protein 55 [Dipodomys spectabilis]|uniref:testis-specific expressed protein 55 n=1 Tax=Dipodomys spectabilis TaxID=105255 RepID=UPI001C5435EA|nr:testis-specific expressed protein 55 [Dipodomys spectabilis]